MDIVFLGQQNWDVCWTAKQQFATRLAERGHRVLYVDPLPADPKQAQALRRDGAFGVPGLRRVGPRDLWVYTYVKIPALRWRVNRLRFFRMAPGVLRAIGMHSPVALCLHPVLLPWLKRAGCRAWVYYAVDEYTAYHGMPERMKREVRAAENELLAAAEVALAVSPALHRRFAAINPDTVLLENGADREHYHPERLARIATHRGVSDLTGTVIGLIGQVDNRIDQDLVLSLARARRDWTFVFAGRVFAIDPAVLAAEPNVRLLGYQPYQALPSIAKRVDAWILPYVRTELTNSCNPLKLYEYLATGRPVVATPLDGIRGTREHVTLAEGPAAFLAALEAAVADPDRGRPARLAAAAANDWYERADRLETVLERAAETARRNGRAEARTLVPVARIARRRRHGEFVSEHGRHFEPAVGRLQRLAQPWTRALGLPWYALRLAGRAAAGRPCRVRSILVVRRGYLGDFVVLMPALAYLRRHYPDARIVLGVQHDMSSADLFQAGGYVDEVIHVDVLRHNNGRWGQLRGIAGLFARGFDLVIGGGLYTMLAEGLHTGAPSYVGLHDGHPDQDIDGRALPRDDFRHESENNLALVEAIVGEPATEADRMAPLRLPEERVAALRAAIDSRLDLAPGAPVLVVHPGSKRETRRWPLDRLAAAITVLLAERDTLTVVLTGGLGERPLTAAVRAGLPEALRGRVRDTAGATGLLDLVALLDRADAMLSNDTGVMHLGRSRGTPLVALMGPENDKVWGPAPLGPAPAISLRHIVPCAPCLRDTCEALYCMRGLGVAEVVMAVHQVLETGRPVGPSAVPVDRRRRRAHWSDVAAAGHTVPLVTVVIDATGSADGGGIITAALPAIERQTYPRIEILALVRPGAPWQDDRRPEQRAALPIRVASPHADETARDAAATAAGGDLVVWIEPGVQWPAAHLAVDVAAALRAPEEGAFRYGRPARDAGHAVTQRRGGAGGPPPAIRQATGTGPYRKLLRAFAGSAE